MKIEMGESLIASYLKHVKGCKIVQTNWTPSGNWLGDLDEGGAKRLKYSKDGETAAKELYKEFQTTDLFSSVFKKSKFDQLLKQAEIDVLGIDIENEEIYAVDVAFHYDGLNYTGGKTKSGENVIKKIIRSVFIMQRYFGLKNFQHFHSYFVTPKVGRPSEKIIKEYIKTTRDILQADGYENITIDFISNDDFYQKIVNKLITVTKKEHDSAELFLRAFKLLELGKKYETKMPKHTKQTKEEENDLLKIGQLAKETLEYLFQNDLLSPSEIKKLQTAEYSKEKFGLNWPMLRPIKEGHKDEKGYGRYYNSLTLGDKYYLTSQWFERQRPELEAWVKEIEAKKS